MGDVAASLITLGYHERINQGSPIPDFVSELRKSIFARVYWADKTLSIFMGRSPRILKSVCNTQLPNYRTDEDSSRGEVATIDLVADTRCSARFAMLKETSLDLFRTRSVGDQTAEVEKARSDLEKVWLELPQHFRLVPT